MLIVAQIIAEGGWLAVVAAAIQVVFGQAPVVGPLELAVLAGAGLGWVRRRFWLRPRLTGIGLAVLTAAGGLTVWLMDPSVPSALTAGDWASSLAFHPAAWLGSAAVLRGARHHTRRDDADLQDDLLRWGMLAVAAAWLVGSLAARRPGADPSLSSAFAATALIATIAFAAAGLAAASLAHVAAAAAGRPGRPRSWLSVSVVLALAVVAVGVVMATVLGVPTQMLLLALLGPIRVILTLGVVLALPLAVLGGWLAESLHEIIPSGLLFRITFPRIDLGNFSPTSPAPTIIFFVVVGLLILAELVVVLIYLRWRFRATTSTNEEPIEASEERAIVRPSIEPPATASRAPRRQLDPADPVDAYLLALAELAGAPDHQREPAETPAAHLRRLANFPGSVSFRRLATAYQLIRYGRRSLSDAERARTASRLAAFRLALRRQSP